MRQNTSYLDRLSEHYGITSDPRLGGFLLPDGSFLDFSEGSGQRSQDHRNVTWVLPRGAGESRYDSMVQVAKRASMYRWMPESWSLEAWTAPTKRQLDKIESLAARKSITVEASDGKRQHFAQYEPHESEQVAQDLGDFFRGRKPRVRRNATGARRRGGVRIVVLLPAGVEPNGRSSWRDYVKGEWWLDSRGQSTFADIDMGEAGHEQIAIDNMVDVEELLRGLAAWYRSKGPLSEGWGREEADNKADELEGMMDSEIGASQIVLNEYVPDKIGAAAAGSMARWKDLKEDARAAYAKHEGAILAIDTAFAAWKVTEGTIEAIQTFIHEQSEDDEDIDDPSTKVLVEQLGPPKKWGSMPIQEFMLISKPKELFR